MAGARRVAVLEDIVNYTNIGAVFRSAAALGIDAVLVTPSCHDPLVPPRCARVDGDGVPGAVDAHRQRARLGGRGRAAACTALGFATAALALSDDAIPSARCDACAHCEQRWRLFSARRATAWSPSTIMPHATTTVKIPMDHGVDSLNVAAASAVAFWELRTQNR